MGEKKQLQRTLDGYVRATEQERQAFKEVTSRLAGYQDAVKMVAYEYSVTVGRGRRDGEGRAHSVPVTEGSVWMRDKKGCFKNVPRENHARR